jgi:hypothetical protein
MCLTKKAKEILKYVFHMLIFPVRCRGGRDFIDLKNFTSYIRESFGCLYFKRKYIGIISGII